MTQNIEQSVQALNIIKIWWLMLNFEIDVMWLITGIDLIHMTVYSTWIEFKIDMKLDMKQEKIFIIK